MRKGVPKGSLGKERGVGEGCAGHSRPLRKRKDRWKDQGKKKPRKKGVLLGDAGTKK